MKWTMPAILGALLLWAMIAYADDSVRIAVASDGQNPTAQVSDRAARCRYYLIFDGVGRLIEIVDNPYRDVGGGAGPTATNFLAQRGVTTVIAESFGHKMINALKEKGIDSFEYKGKTESAVKSVLRPM